MARAVPSCAKPGKLGDRWLGVIPIAQGAVIGGVLVQLIALERRTNGALLTACIARLEEDGPTERVAWPKLQLKGQDDSGTSYRMNGGNGIGSQSDWHVEYGLVGELPEGARRLAITATELYWEDLSSGMVEGSTTGAWTFAVDLSRELPARMA